MYQSQQDSAPPWFNPVKELPLPADTTSQGAVDR